MGVGGQRHALAALSPGKTRYPLYRRLDRPQGRSGRVRKTSHPPGFDPRTVAITTELSRPINDMQKGTNLQVFRREMLRPTSECKRFLCLSHPEILDSMFPPKRLHISTALHGASILQQKTDEF